MRGTAFVRDTARGVSRPDVNFATRDLEAKVDVRGLRERYSFPPYVRNDKWCKNNHKIN